MSDGSQRIETGCVQFDDDWPGIFIRGDHALMGYAPALRAVLAGKYDTWGLQKAEARGLLSLLESCRADAAKPFRLTVRADTPRPQDAARIAELEAENARLRDEARELKRQLGGGCEANHGGDHTVIRQGRYSFCALCGESLRGVRFCHEPPAALAADSGAADA